MPTTEAPQRDERSTRPGRDMEVHDPDRGAMLDAKGHEVESPGAVREIEDEMREAAREWKAE